MKNKNFAVFIPSHGRPYRQKTVDMLVNGGYENDWFIVCDNEDETLEDYKKVYKDRVIVFDKSEYMKKVDTVDNFQTKKSVVYARNAIFDIAREKGYKYFAMMDDDVSRLKIRFVKDGRLDFQHVRDYPRLFDAVIEFQEQAGIDSVSFGMSFDFIGGISSSNFAKGFTRVGYCIFFFRAESEQNFIGTIGEDLNHSWLTQERGGLVFSLTRVQVDTDPITDTEGGFYDLYKSYEDSLKYMQVIYTLIPRPDSVSMGYTKKGIVLKRNLDTMYPKIISAEWKK